MSPKTITFETYIPASPAQVYYAFTNASALREWLCDLATVDPKPGGRLYLYWNSGYYSSGEYTALEAGKSAAFIWCGRNDPGRSQVSVTFEPQESGTRLFLEHSLPDDGGEWEKVIAQVDKGWRDSLENLACVLESGKDLRFINRPMLGITLSDFTVEQAQKLGVPVKQGLRIDSVVEGMGAHAAGLQPNDVIVRISGQETVNFFSIPSIMAGRRAGEMVQVEFYRGPELKVVQMELSRRPLPQIPPTAEALAKMVEQRNARCFTLLEEVFAGVNEAEADFHPEGGEWSAKEILAHLIQGERYNQIDIIDRLTGFERWADDWGGNPDIQVQATVTAYPTVAELLAELKRAYAETAGLLARLPQSFVERKGSYWQLAYNYTEENTHLDGHIEQIKATVQAARNNSQ
jgi:uncharacterized protein YndB with AHSA1/START domain